MAEPSASTFTGLPWLKTIQEMEIINISMKTFTHVTQQSRDKQRYREITRHTQAASSLRRWNSYETIYKSMVRKMLHFESALKN